MLNSVLKAKKDIQYDVSSHINKHNTTFTAY